MGAAFSSYFNQCFPPKATFTVKDLPDLTGKVYIVTGGNCGVGKEIVKGLLERNATVYLGARSPSKAAAALKDLEDSTGKKAIFLQMDLTDLLSVRKAATEFGAKEKEVHGLILNAGVMTPPIEMVTADGYDLQFATNVLGHFFLMKSLLPILLSTVQTSPDAKPRVIFTSSALEVFGTLKFDTFKDGPARRKFGTIPLYNQSKMANVVLSQELARRYGKDGVVSSAVNPGNLHSELQRYASRIRKFLLSAVLYPTPMGALTPLYAVAHPDATSPNGEYYIPWARRGYCNPMSKDPELGRQLWSYLDEQVERFENN
ncbi:NAD(P)-binding protein [Fistulina hepatica ATCC 64428]|nr:NAD(P)-binding protein [Fistulina hepatica ATCC 64428]